jgi:hypothetical protein
VTTRCLITSDTPNNGPGHTYDASYNAPEEGETFNKGPHQTAP